MQRERLTKALSGLTGAVELDEVGAQGIKEGTVAGAEIATATVEAELADPSPRK